MSVGPTPAPVHAPPAAALLDVTKGYVPWSTSSSVPCADAVRAVYSGEEVDYAWLEAVLEASVSQRFYQDRGIRALVAFGLCVEADDSLARFIERRPDAPEVEELTRVVRACGDLPAVEPADAPDEAPTWRR